MLIIIPGQLESQAFLLFIMLTSSLLRSIQAFTCHICISWHKPDLKMPGNCHQRRFKLVVVHVVRVRWMRLARHNLVRRQNADQGSVQQPGCDILARAGARPSSKAQMAETTRFSLCRRINSLKPSLRVKLSRVWAEMVNI